MSEGEYRTHLGLWAILAAPLIAGNDLTRMTPFTVDMLTNREVIAIDQDPLGKQGYPIIQEGPFEVWIKPMADHSSAVGLFNRGKEEDKMNVKFSDLGISGTANVRDVWLRKDLGVFHETFSAYVPKHGVVLLRISPR
jgi:alpha-galactosidase